MEPSSLFSGDIPALKTAGLLQVYNALGIIAMLAAALAFALFLIAGGVNWRAKDIAHEKYLAALQGEGFTDILWVADEKKLAELEFGAPRKVGDLLVYQREVPAKSPADVDAAYPRTNVVIKRGKKTVAVADIIRVHDAASWEIGSSDKLRMGTEIVSLPAAFESPSFRDACVPLQVPSVSVIFIGLESFPTSDRKKDRDLSADRANALGEACLDYLRAHIPLKSGTTFWAVGLGRAQDSTDLRSAPEVRQRAAVMMTVLRRASRDETIGLPDAFSALVQTTRVSGTDLSRYTLSSDAADRLRMSGADFAGFLPTGIATRPRGSVVH